MLTFYILILLSLSGIVVQKDELQNRELMIVDGGKVAMLVAVRLYLFINVCVGVCICACACAYTYAYVY